MTCQKEISPPSLHPTHPLTHSCFPHLSKWKLWITKAERSCDLAWGQGCGAWQRAEDENIWIANSILGEKEPQKLVRGWAPRAYATPPPLPHHGHIPPRKGSPDRQGHPGEVSAACLSVLHKARGTPRLCANDRGQLSAPHAQKPKLPFAKD